MSGHLHDGTSDRAFSDAAGSGEGCSEQVCVTCSDEAVPVTLVRLLDHGLAIVDAGGVREEVSVALVDAAVGDTVLVHAKEAIAVIARGSPDGVAGGSGNDGE